MVQNNIEKINFWFSQKIKRYNIIQKSLKFSQQEVIVDWDNCLVSIVGKKSGKTRIVLRSSSEHISKYMGRAKTKEIELRYMIGIDISSISEPLIEDYEVDQDQIRKHLPNENRTQIKRVVFKLDDKYWLWEEYSADISLQDTNIYKLYLYVNNFLEQKKDLLDPDINDLFRVSIDVEKINTEIKNEVIPIIFQPAIDELKNFLREIHCYLVEPNIIEITLIFNNEELRKFSLLNKIYEKIRLIVYGRIMDIETFRIYFDTNDKINNDKKYRFENIYSNIDNKQYGIEYDTIHGDPPPDVPLRKVKYYFLDYNHPVVFINTSNHAMAENDNNHEIWKWEYIPFLSDSPVVYGTKSRKEIDSIYKSLKQRIYEFWGSVNLK